MNILITGATGLIGRALVLRLRAEGHDLTAWVRSTERARNQLQLRCDAAARDMSEWLRQRRRQAIEQARPRCGRVGRFLRRVERLRGRKRDSSSRRT